MPEIEFLHPAWLWLLWVCLPMIVWYVWKERRARAALRMSTILPFAGVSSSWRTYGRHVLFIFRLLAVVSLVIVLARPQSSDRWESVSTEGIDIVLALDVSGSMLARDFSPDRLVASKVVGTEFISGRTYDRIGLVVFAGESFTQCPLTTDHATLINLLNATRSGIIEDGTAIGMGLATAISRLRESSAPSKVIILLTDGVNNRGEIDPLTAAELATSFSIKVYTIGVGTTGQALYPVQTPAGTRYQTMDVEIDEEVLEKIAGMTGGKYFRATNTGKLREIYREIDQLERTTTDIKQYHRKQEEYMRFAWGAVILLLLELLLRISVFKYFP